MGPVSATTSIDAPREAVHALLSDLSLRPAFTDHFIDEFRLERLEPVGVGAAARFRIPHRGLWMETVIEESSPPHRIVERGSTGRNDRIPVFVLWELVEGPSPELSEVTVTFMLEPGNSFDRLIHGRRGRWYRRQWAKALSRLKGLAESSQAVEHLAVAGADRLPG